MLLRVQDQLASVVYRAHAWTVPSALQGGRGLERCDQHQKGARPLLRERVNPEPQSAGGGALGCLARFGIAVSRQARGWPLSVDDDLPGDLTHAPCSSARSRSAFINIRGGALEFSTAVFSYAAISCGARRWPLALCSRAGIVSARVDPPSSRPWQLQRRRPFVSSCHRPVESRIPRRGDKHRRARLDRSRVEGLGRALANPLVIAEVFKFDPVCPPLGWRRIAPCDPEPHGAREWMRKGSESQGAASDRRPIAASFRGCPAGNRRSRQATGGCFAVVRFDLHPHRGQRLARPRPSTRPA